MKIPEPIESVYHRFLRKECTSEELQQLFHFFGTTDEAQLRAMIRDAEDETEKIQSPQRSAKLEKLYEKISHTIDYTDKPVKTRIINGTIIKWTTTVAAILAVVAFFLIRDGNQTIQWVTVNAPYGKITKVELPDHSSVVLNAGSILRYPKDFNDDKRVVTLENGQAFFDIRHEKVRAFLVSANGLDVSVLGTSFEVNAFKNEQQVSVAVGSGKVGVVQTAVNGKSLFLLPGERATLDKASHKISRSKVPLSDIAIWQDHRILFENQLLSEVFQSLERKYNVQFKIQSKQLIQERISMRLNNEPLENVMGALSFAKHFKYEIIDEKLVIVK